MRKKLEPVGESEVEAGIKDISPDHYMWLKERMRLEQQLHWLVSSPGMFVPGLGTSFSQIRSVSDALTQERLQGSTNKLNAGTLIHWDKYTYPRDLTPSGYRELEWKASRDSDKVRIIGRIALMEPGIPIFRPIKTEFAGYFEGKNADVTMAKALQLYLNNPELFMTSEAEEEVASEIAQVLQLDQEREDEAFKHVSE
jgi:hypothetical protein